VPMVAKATGISPPGCAADRQQHQQPELGFLGASYIDVLQLNEALPSCSERHWARAHRASQWAIDGVPG